MYHPPSGSTRQRARVRLTNAGRRLRRQPRLALVAMTPLLLAAAMLHAGPVSAAAPAPQIVPPVGPLYDVLSVAWWKYVLAQPTAVNPLTDDSGARCAIGQSGPVFFIGGDFNGHSEPITRDRCQVPAGKALFFPMVNAVDVHVPLFDNQDTPQLIWDDLQTTLGFNVSSLQASVDGVAVSDLDPATSPYRGCAGPVPACTPRSFSLQVPAGNLFGIDAGTYAPAVADGFYLLLAPLKPGPHTVTFGGNGHLGGDFSQEITYNLLVKRPGAS